MRSRRYDWGWALAVAASLMATGCAEISLTPIHTQERVVSTRKHIVPSDSARVRARIDGTVLILRATRACNLVAFDTIERIVELGPDEELTEEAVILGMGAIPLGIGIGVLVDAPNVHDRDRNAPQYNPVGRKGAYVAGSVLTSLGGLIALVPIIELMRVAAAGEVEESVVTRDGAILERDVACSGSPQPLRTSVMLRVGSTRLATQGTNRDGLLELDLADAIPNEIARRAVVIEVVVDDRIVAEVDVRIVLDEQERRALRAPRDAIIVEPEPKSSEPKSSGPNASDPNVSETHGSEMGATPSEPQPEGRPSEADSASAPSKLQPRKGP
jgi:hypothetical protein